MRSCLFSMTNCRLLCEMETAKSQWTVESRMCSINKHGWAKKQGAMAGHLPVRRKFGARASPWQLLISSFALSIAAFLSSCDKERNMSDASARKSEHGLVEGMANTIKVGSASFRIPPEVRFDVRTEGVAEPGRAETLIIYINVANLMENPPAENNETLGRNIVRVEIRSHAYHPGNSIFSRAESLGAPRTREDLGLLEYPGTGGGQTDYSRSWKYRSIAPNERGDFPMHTEIFCQVAWPDDPKKINGTCNSTYYTKTGIAVESFFSFDLLNKWDSVLDVVVNAANEYEVK